MTTEEQINFWSLVLGKVSKNDYGLCIIVNDTFDGESRVLLYDSATAYWDDRNDIFKTLYENKPDTSDIMGGYWWPPGNRLVRKRYVIRIIRELQGKKYNFWDWLSAIFI